MSHLSIEDFRIGWICATPSELAASTAILDKEYLVTFPNHHDDTNTYHLGLIDKHNVVMACLPAGSSGAAPAATVAAKLVSTFNAVRYGLLVGVGAGIPDLENDRDIRLGDVVVSAPIGTEGGVVQYDSLIAFQHRHFERTGHLNSPPELLLSAVAKLQAKHIGNPSRIPDYLNVIRANERLKNAGYIFPEHLVDTLLCACNHQNPAQCQSCAHGVVIRGLRETTEPQIHYGTIASGSLKVRDALTRDLIGDKCNAICIDREAAGLMKSFRCLVIRGICDYADASADDKWRNYAAATAAAFAKELLLDVSVEKTRDEQRLGRVMDILTRQTESAERYYRQQELNRQDGEQRECHQSFCTSIYVDHKNINRDPIPGTCRWILDHPRYLEWLTSPQNNLLLIYAHPGCGKSVLSRYLIDVCLQGAGTTSTTAESAPHTICYFFFKDKEDQDNVAQALCAVLHQLFTQQPWLIHHALAAHQETGSKLQQDMEKMWRILLSAASDPEAKSITCILDALDECRDTQHRKRFLDLVAQFYAQSSLNPTSRNLLKILMTSRPDQGVESHFARFQSIQIRGQDNSDGIHREIDLVIGTTVEDLANELCLSQIMKERVKANLLAMRNRTYLWLHLAIEEFKVTINNSLAPEQETFVDLPSSVEDAYEKILSRITGAQMINRVRKIFTIMVGARRTLTVDEMALALGVADGSTVDSQQLWRKLPQWCGLFVFIHQGKLHLIHQTAEDFLLACQCHTAVAQLQWKGCLLPTEVEKTMAQICVLFLVHHKTRDEKESDKKTLSKSIDSFFSFCAEHWAQHVCETQNILDATTRRAINQLYDTSSELYTSWTSIMWRTSDYSGLKFNMNEIMLTAFNGHVPWLKRALQASSSEIDSRDANDRTALMWAAEEGHAAAVRVLLNAKSNVNDQNKEDGDALQLAALAGHEKIVRMLLQHGADVSAICGPYGNALQAAAEEGHVGIVKLLVKSGANIDARLEGYGNALQLASSMGQESVVRVLLKSGADVNAEGGDYGSALQVASYGGHAEVVKMLLQYNADVNYAGGDLGTALLAASEEGHEQVVRMLLESGADVDQTCEGFDSPLQAASSEGHERIVQMLLEWKRRTR